MTLRKWTEQQMDGYTLIHNEDGATISYAPDSGVSLIEEDGFAFKDLNANGILDPYEDWRLPIEVRIDDLVSQMTIEEIAGLMLYSAHQSVITDGNSFAEKFAGTYNGKKIKDSDAEIWNLTDQQKAFLEKDHLRHVLVTLVESPEVSAKWNNEMQKFVEGTRLGIPVNISTDPRHGADANSEYNAGSGGDISKWPDQLGLAATFDPESVRTFGKIGSTEYRALGIGTALSPQIDLATEPRWMRFNGTFGEGTQLVTELAEAYCDGFQTTENTENGWGNQSVNAMVKHWPGGGSGEAGRDAHYAYGKYAVYPGNNFEEHLQPFLQGAFKLKGKTNQASAVMPYYTISSGQDTANHEEVGNGFSHFMIQELLRDKYGYDGVVCTDWGITGDETSVDTFLSGKSWGVENLSIAERHYKVLMAGVDQFGGNNDVAPIMEAYQMGVKEHGQDFMDARFRRSGSRLLRNIFNIGLFENPYVSPQKSQQIVGNPEFMKAGFEVQQKSIVMLKNKNQVLPMKKGKKVYIPNRYVAESKDWFGQTIPAHEIRPVETNIVEKYYQLVDSPEEADFALVFITSPKTVGFDAKEVASGNNGYIPVSLQYRPYTAKLARAKSLAGGDPLEKGKNRTYLGKSNTPDNATDLETILATKKKMGEKPVIVSLSMTNPTVVNEFEAQVDGILADFGVQAQSIFTLIAGEVEPSGLLPFQMPANMDTVELQLEDIPLDMECHVDETGNCYQFGFGLNFKGRISDWRTEKYVPEKLKKE
jgi:beta-glucosidase